MIARRPLEDAHSARRCLSAARPVVVRGVIEDLDHGLDAIRPETGQRGACAITHPTESLAGHRPVHAEGPLEMWEVLVAESVRVDRAAWPVPVIDALLPGKHWFGHGDGRAPRPPFPAPPPRRVAPSDRRTA